MSKKQTKERFMQRSSEGVFLSVTLAIALAISAVAAIAAGSAGSADDACIISDGTAGTGINTGFFYDSDSRIEIDYAFMSTDRPMMRLFGRDYTSPRVSFCVYNGNGAFVFDNADHTAVHYGTTGLAADTSRHTIIVDQPNRKAYFISDCVTNATVTIPSTPTAKAARPIALFGVTDTVGLTVTFESGSATSYRSSTARIYRAKFWKGDTLVRDLEPLVKGGVPGFRDNVSGAFLTAENNTQLAAFSASPETPSVLDDGYVSTPGNNSGAGEKLYFDTGYVPNDRTRVELDFAQCESYPEAGYSGNHNWFLFYAADAFNMYYNKNGMGWSAGNSWKGFTPGVTAARIQDKDVRRTAILDMKNLSAPASLVTVGYTNCVSSSAGAGINISTSLAIAANRTGGSAGALKIYGCRIFEDGSPVHSFEPYVKDGIAGLLDTIGDKGFISAPIATDALKIVAGGSIASAPGWRDAYIESDGTQSIDTGITLGVNMRTEIDFQHLTGMAVGRGHYILADNNHHHLYINKGETVFSYSINNKHRYKSFDVSTDTARHRAIIDEKNLKALFITGSVTNKAVSISTARDADVSSTVRLFSYYVPADGRSEVRIYSFRVYDNDVLAHEYVPYVQNGVVGFWDTVDKVFKTTSSGNALKISGMTVDGVEKWIVTPQNGKVTKGAGTTSLSASAAGAIRYKWTRNGVPISGGTDGNLTVPWRWGGKTDDYAVTAIYNVFGVETDGAPVHASVENAPQGTMFVVR